jgi:hypothetical protein
MRERERGRYEALKHMNHALLLFNRLELIYEVFFENCFMISSLLNLEYIIRNVHSETTIHPIISHPVA